MEVLRELKPIVGQAALETHLGGEPVKLKTLEAEVPISALDFQLTSKAGFEVSEKGGVFVALNTQRDEKLVAEGLARDLARRLQRLRKERGFVPTAVLGMGRVAGLDQEEIELLAPLKDDLSFMVRVREFRLLKEKTEDAQWVEDDLDGKPIFLDVA
jgi:isoleucyl-tRNA synthetase